MIDELLRKNEKLDEIIFCDTGYEFPQMYKYIEQMELYWNKKYPKLKITKLNYKKADIWTKRSESPWSR
jgi:3'-phosphoadenosine 5'-phosphosulfate sulfotransferase (PAPS reductase)/FAD synthetase